MDAALRLTKALQTSEDQPPLLTNRKSTYETIKELSNIFLNRLNSATPPRVAEKVPALQIRQSPRVANKAMLNNKNEKKMKLLKPQNPSINPSHKPSEQPSTKRVTFAKGVFKSTSPKMSTGSARAQRAKIRNKIRAAQQTEHPNKLPNRQRPAPQDSEAEIIPKPETQTRVTPFVAQSDLPPIPHVIPQENVKDKIHRLYKVINKNQKISEHVRKNSDQSLDKPHLIAPDTHLINNVMNAVLNKETGELLEHRQLVKGPDRNMWITALANDLGRLAQGVGTRMKKGTNTMFFIHPSKIPKDKKSTYCKLVASIRPLKTEVNRV